MFGVGIHGHDASPNGFRRDGAWGYGMGYNLVAAILTQVVSESGPPPEDFQNTLAPRLSPPGSRGILINEALLVVTPQRIQHLPRFPGFEDIHHLSARVQ